MHLYTKNNQWTKWYLYTSIFGQVKQHFILNIDFRSKLNMNTQLKTVVISFIQLIHHLHQSTDITILIYILGRSHYKIYMQILVIFIVLHNFLWCN